MTGTPNGALKDKTVLVVGRGSGLAHAIALAALDAGARLVAAGRNQETLPAAYAGEPVPTFAAVARYAIANGIACNVEIKPCPGREAETGEVVARLTRQFWSGVHKRPLLSSFSEEALAAAQAASWRVMAPCRLCSSRCATSTSDERVSVSQCRR